MVFVGGLCSGLLWWCLIGICLLGLGLGFLVLVLFVVGCVFVGCRWGRMCSGRRIVVLVDFVGNVVILYG